MPKCRQHPEGVSPYSPHYIKCAYCRRKYLTDSYYSQVRPEERLLNAIFGGSRFTQIKKVKPIKKAKTSAIISVSPMWSWKNGSDLLMG